MWGEEPPICPVCSEGEDVTSGEVPRKGRGLAAWGSGMPCDVWRGAGDEGEFEVGVEGASSSR